MEPNNVKNPLVGEAIDRLGRDSAVAKRLSVTTWAVSKWRQSLPEKRVLTLAELTAFKYTPHQLDPAMYPNPNDGLPINHPDKETSHDHANSIA